MVEWEGSYMSSAALSKTVAQKEKQVMEHVFFNKQPLFQNDNIPHFLSNLSATVAEKKWLPPVFSFPRRF